MHEKQRCNESAKQVLVLRSGTDTQYGVCCVVWRVGCTWHVQYMYRLVNRCNRLGDATDFISLIPAVCIRVFFLALGIFGPPWPRTSSRMR